MADNNKVNIAIDVSSGGTTDAETKAALKLKAALEAAAAAGTSTSKAISSSKKSSSPGNSGRAQADNAEGRSYGVSRSITEGGTGAAARDFAKQSQGLGGVVHLYATLAANIFAAGAAFSALSTAMDTTNMVKGMDQLGAASGRGLGNLAKQVFALTDGAVSMREAMEATTKATAAGMSDKNLLRLATGAKNASQALGLSMPDALSRLSRGITKMEPELLDELGIFIRIDDAVAKYSRTVGISVNMLTDYQRRMAFAAEALTQVEEKFGNIKIDANPYSQLAAALSNITQKGLELVNKVLGPIVKLFSENSSLLVAAIGLIGTKLVGMALPAIGAWNESLKESANTAAASAKRIKDSFGDDFQAKLEKRFDLPKLDQQLASAEAKLKATQVRIANSPLQAPTSLKNQWIDVPMEQRGTKELTAMNKALESRNTIIATGQSGANKASVAKLAQLAKETSFIEAQILATKELQQATMAVAKAAAIREIGWNKAQSVADSPTGRFSPDTLAIKEYEKAQAIADKSNRLAMVAQTTRIAGVRGAMSELNKDLTTSGVGAWTKYSTLAQGGLISIGSRISSIVSSLGAVGLVAGVIIGVVASIYNYFSSASAETDKFNTSVAALSSAAKTAAESLDSMYKIAGKSGKATVASFTASANAIQGITETAQASISDIDKMFNKMNWSERLWDRVLSVFNSGSQLLAVNLTKAIEQAVKISAREGTSEQTKKDFAIALGMDSFNPKMLEDRISALKKTPGGLDDTLKVLVTLDTQIRKSEQSFVALNESTVKGTLLLQEFIKTLNVSDSIGKIGINMVETGAKLNKVLLEPIEKIIPELALLSQDTGKLILLDPSAAKGLQLAGAELDKLNTKYREAQDSAENYSTKVTKAEAAIAIARDVLIKNKSKKNEMDYAKAYAELDTLYRVGASGFAAQVSTLKIDMAKVAEQFKNAGYDSIVAGAAVLEKSLDAGFTKARIAMARAELQGPAGVGDSAAQFNLNTLENNLQKEQIAVSIKLAANLDALNQTQDEILQRSIIDSKTSTVPEKIKAALSLATSSFRSAYKESGMTTSELSKVVGDKSASTQEKDAAVSLIDLAAKSAKGQAELALIAAKQRQEEVANQIASLQEIYDRSVRLEVVETSRLAVIQNTNSALANISGTITAQGSIEATNFALQEQRVKSTREQLFYTNEIAKLNTTAPSALRDNKIKDTRVLASKALINSELQVLDIILKENLAAGVGVTERLRKQLDFQEKLNVNKDQNAALDIALDEAKLASFKSLSTVSERFSINETYRLSLAKQDLEIAKARRIEGDAVALSQSEIDTKRAAIQEKIKEQNKQKGTTGYTNSADVAALGELNRLQTQLNATRDSGSAALDLKAKIDKDMLQIARDTNLELDKQARAMLSVVSAAESLASVFNDIGAKFGGGMVSMLKATQIFTNKRTSIDKDYEAGKLKAVKDAGTSEVKRESNLFKAKEKYTNESIKNDLDYYSESAAAAKSMFSEKTVAYKVFEGIEKAMHLGKLALVAAETAAKVTAWVEELAVKASTEAGQTGLTLTGVMSRIPMYATEIYGKTIGQLGPIAGPVVATGLIAAMLSMLGGGGGGFSMPGGITSADRQETQGTGTSWKDGAKVENGGGVFGDASAKSTSIANSLTIIRDNSLEGITYDTRMLKSLESIDNGINKASQGLYSSTGLRVGSAVGTQEGTSTSGIKGLFGSSTTKNIIDAGVAIKGTFKALIDGAGSLTKYETVSSTKTNSGFFGLFGSTNTSISTATSALEADIAKQITSIFAEAGKAFTVAGAKLGMTAEAVMSKLGNVNVDQLASLRGLTGSALETEFNNIIGNILDSASSSLFSQLTKYRKFGEGMLETVTRVVDGSDKLAAGFNSINKSVVGVNIGQVSFDLTEAIISVNGGLSKFLDSTKNFADNFLTEADRLIPVQTSVTKEMARLGLSSVTTREQFASAVSAIDLSSTTGQQLYADLMNVATGFAMITPAIKASMSAEDKRTKQLDLQVQILTLEGRVSEALNITRKQELAILDASLRPMQEYIYALEDRTKLIMLERDILSESGYANKALLVTRAMELRSLTDAEKILKKTVYALEDKVKTDDLLLNLMTAEGKIAEVAAINKARELKAMSATDAAIKKRINALEKEAIVANKLKTAITNTITSLEGSIKTLSEYQNSLAISDKSTLSPVEKYAEAKRQALSVAALASGIANTDSEKLAKQEAINKLPAAAGAFLDASRAIYASSAEYAQDYSYVRQLLTESTTALTKQKTEAEKQLDFLNTSAGALLGIETATETTASLMQQFIVSMAEVASNPVTSTLSVTTALTNTLSDALLTTLGINSPIYTAISSIPTSISDLINNLVPAANDARFSNIGIPSIPKQGVSTLAYGGGGSLSHGDYNNSYVNAYADGGVAPKGMAMVGEKGPELVNFNSQAQVYTAGQTGSILSDINKDLIKEVRALREEVTLLRKEQNTQTGHLIQTNYDANQRNASLVVAATEAAVNTQDWNQRSKVKLA